MILGIIGGGQLAMFLCIAAKKRNIETIVLDPNANCSASKFCSDFIKANYDNSLAIEKLFEQSDMVTFEFENIDLKVLVDQNLNKLIPKLNSLYISSDRLIEKITARDSGLNVGKFFPINCIEDFDLYKVHFDKAVLKTRKLGYDGRGQYIVNSNTYFDTSFFNNEFILEEYIDYDFELSAICARNRDDKFCFLTSSINTHTNHMLFKSTISNLDLSDVCKNFMEQNNLYGILTLEFFVKDGVYYFNELAPRPHNSGHSTIDACNYNQNDIAISAIFDNDFPSIACSKMTMFNIIGFKYNLNFNIPNSSYYDYYKDEILEKRKMAHINTNNEKAIETIELLLEDADG